jgi:hypothetical protein
VGSSPIARSENPFPKKGFFVGVFGGFWAKNTNAIISCVFSCETGKFRLKYLLQVLPETATWPSGKARVCKTLIMGSNPIVASIFLRPGSGGCTTLTMGCPGRWRQMPLSPLHIYGQVAQPIGAKRLITINSLLGQCGHKDRGRVRTEAEGDGSLICARVYGSGSRVINSIPFYLYSLWQG